MAHIWIARQTPPRRGVFLKNQGVMIPLYKMGKNQLAEIVDAQLEKSGVPKEERSKAIEQAELDYEQRVKTFQVSREIRRRLEGQLPTMSRRGGRWQFRKPGI